MSKMKKYLILALMIIVVQSSGFIAYAEDFGLLSMDYSAPTYTDYTGDAVQLINQLVGGNENISVDNESISVIGPNNNIKFFGDFYAGVLEGYDIVLNAGVKITNGPVNAPGDSDLLQLIHDTYGGSYSSNDATGFAFDFTVTEGIKAVSLEFMYASDEYPGYVGGAYIDGAALFVDGVNYAFYENEGNQELLTTLFGDPFIAAGGFTNLKYGGIIRPYKINALLNPDLDTHTIKVVVHDTGDSGVDSSFFISLMAGSYSTSGGIVEINAPELSTQDPANLTVDSAELRGTLISLGDPAATEYGFVYATTPTPDINDSKVNLGAAGSTGSFSHLLSGLSLDTTYYCRSYAVNDSGTVYGGQVSFKTLSDPPPVITIAPYNESEWTTEPIVVNASINEGTINATSHEFTENGSFTFTAVDELG